MPSVYLPSGSYTTYGVPNATANQVAQASALIDAILQRPEGLVWTPDATGQPAFMAGMSADYTFTLMASIAAGTNVLVQMSGPTNMLQIGDVLILDRANPSLLEAVVVNSVSAPGIVPVTVTLQSVVNAHASASIAEHGLVIEEQRYPPKNRPIVMLTRAPMLRILSGVGRYGYARRGNVADNASMQDFNLLASLSRFGGPPYWELFNPAFASNWDPTTAQLWLPAGILLEYYSEVKVRYVAGFAAANIPAAVQNACAQIIIATTQDPGLGNAKSYKAGGTAIQKFSPSIVSDDMKAMLAPYAARSFL